MKAKFLLWALVPGVVVALGIFFLLRGQAVSGVLVRRGDLTHTVVASGRVAPAARSTLGFTVSGRVKEVRAKEGDHVRASDVLVVLEDREAAAAVEQARAAVAQAQARRDALRTISGRVAEADQAQAKAAVDLAEQRLRRLEALVATGATSQDELDQARANAEQARARLRASQSQVAGSRAQGAELRAAEAALAQARAALELAEARLEQTRVRAPADGTVLSRAVEPGDVVSPGQPLLGFAWDGPFHLVMEPDEKTLRLLSPGQEAVVSAEAWPGRTFKARITEILPAVDVKKGTVEVRLDLVDPKDYLRPDMTVSIELTVAKKSGALVVPVAALDGVRGEKAKVWVVKEGRGVPLEVQLGVVGEDRAEVLDGLSEGEVVLLEPKKSWSPGMRVRVRELRP